MKVLLLLWWLSYCSDALYLTVTENGDKTCTDCKCIDLSSALQRSLHIKETHINVTYSHQLGRSHVFGTHHQWKTVRVFGTNQNVTISCTKEDNQDLYLLAAETAIMQIRDITFKGCRGFRQAHGITLCFYMVTLTSVAFIDTQTAISAVSVHIQNCVFSSTTLTDSVLVILVLGSESSSLLLEGNNFTNLVASKVMTNPVVNIMISTSDYFYKWPFNITVSNCHFTNNTFSIPLSNGGRGLHIAITDDFTGSVSVSKCHFVQTTGAFENLLSIKGRKWVNGSVCLFSNTFSYNDGNGVVVVDTLNSAVYFNNSFVRNTGGNLLTLYLSATHSAAVSHRFNHLNILNSISHCERCSLVQAVCSDCTNGVYPLISFNEVYVSNNVVPPSAAIVFIEQVNVSISNSTFTFNRGTVVKVIHSSVCFSDSVHFSNNSGYQGGGLAIYGRSNLFFQSFTELDFNTNTAAYGGALFIGANLSLSSICWLSNFTTFEENVATVGGPSIYVEDAEQVIRYLDELEQPNFTNYCYDIKALVQSFGTGPFKLNSYNKEKIISVFPGQHIPLDLSIKDANGHISYCMSHISLHCDVMPCNETLLMGPPNMELTTVKLITELYLATSNDEHPSNVTLVMSCASFNISLEVEILECPLGFIYNHSLGVCDCIDIDDVHCSKRFGQACAPKGRWLGKVNSDTTSLLNCDSLYCNVSQAPCPINVPQRNAYILVTDQIYQCTEHRGGIICASCSEGYFYSYEGMDCVFNCSSSSAGAVFFFVLVFQFLLCLLLLFVLKAILECGAGGLYGPLFYLAVLNELPFTSFVDYTGLHNFIAVVLSYVSLDMRMFGLLPACSFKSLGYLSHFGLHFFGPIVTSLILLSMTAVALFVPQCRRYPHISLQLTTALLLLLLYWNFISTGLAIMGAVYINGEARVALQPDLSYFTSEHVVLWLFSFAVITILCFPLVLFITLSKLLSRRIKIARVKLFLYFFQGCYKENYYWYPSVYFIAFFIIALSKSSPLLQQIVLVSVLSLQYLLNPYHLRWMNISDTLLLLNLFFVSSLLYQQVGAGVVDLASIVFIYLFTVSSLLYFIIGGLGMLLYQSGLSKWIDRRWSVHDKLVFIQRKLNCQQLSSDHIEDNESESSIEVKVLDGATTGYREPLLDLMESNEVVINYGIR